MSKCAVYGCIGKKPRDIQYFSLPKSGAKRKLWLETCNISLSDVNSVKICSMHFKNSDFKISFKEDFSLKKVLKRDALPSVNIGVNRLLTRTQKREIRSYDIATQRRLAIKPNFDHYSLLTMSKQSLSYFRYNSGLLYKINERDSEILQLKQEIQCLKGKNDKLKYKYKALKKFIYEN